MSVIPLLAILVQTLTGGTVDALKAPAGTRAIVYLFTSTDCPISNRYAPEIHRIEQAFGHKGVLFRLVYPSRYESDAAIRDHLRSFDFGAVQAVRDSELSLVKFVGATITPEAAVVVDGRVVYRGRIDDRYVDLAVERPAPTTHDLADALAAVLAGQSVPRPVTQAVGCYISDLTR
ncbi:MAG TPA: hypothetical protein VGY48_10735 [Vicinamibacterales bacterium]|jgi:thiol-disulfide isomerase/thioredoxin|nr:hypothetical protein [Vicinamibacterales bacterium]